MTCTPHQYVRPQIERREGRGGGAGYAPAPGMGGMMSSGALGA
jgi:hypothetical protein